MFLLLETVELTIAISVKTGGYIHLTQREFLCEKIAGDEVLACIICRNRTALATLSWSEPFSRQ